MKKHLAMSPSKSLLLRLTNGLSKEDILPDEHFFVDDFLQKEYLHLKDNFYKLNSKYRFGTIGLVQNDTAYLAIIGESSRDPLIENIDECNAKDGYLVIAQKLLGKRGQPSVKIIEILGKEQSYSIAYLAIKDGVKHLLDLKTAHPSGAKVAPDILNDYKDDDLFMIDNKTLEILKYIGNMQDPKIDGKIVLAQFNKHDEFEEDVLALAKSFKEVAISDYPSRVDLRDLAFCTIDPIDAKDFDDAIYWDNDRYTLYVAIADVSEYVKPFGAIDNEAIYRSFSIYLPHRSIPMLPRELSETLCSLQSNVDRLAYVFEMDLDRTTLDVKNSKVYEAIIHSKRRFNYDEVDALFASKLKAKNVTEERVFKTLSELKVVTDKLREIRLKTGYDFNSSEVRMILDNDTNLISTTISSQTPSHSLIEDCMLLANKEAAARFHRGIFRIHESPSQVKLQKLYQELAEIGIFANIKNSIKETIEDLQTQAKELGLEHEVDTLIIRSQMQARYAPYNVGHFGLGFDAYTHFTSPIRRYSDLIVHRLLKAIAAHDTIENSYVLRNIESLSMSISSKEREANEVEQEYMARKFARWALKNIGKTFKAKVVSTDIEPKAELNDVISGATLHLSSRDSLVLFEDILVKIDNSDIYKAKIYATTISRIEKNSV